MNLQRWLQMTTALLAVLGASFLVLTGDQSLFPYALGLSALVALVVTDWFGWVRVPRGLGNLAAVVSVAWTFREFLRLARDREAQLLTISHMLIYLQVVLVFQVKSRRVHWQLLVLSVLQVVVAAALAMGPQFGLLLTVYMAAAIASMILLGYHREVVDESLPPAKPTKSPVSLHRLLDPPQLRSSAARQRQFEQWVRAPWLARCVGMFTVASVIFTLVFFFSAPRLSDAVWQTGRSRNSVSGFSGEIVLKTAGNIRLNDQPAMRATFIHPDTGRAMALATEPYFHGQVLTHYHQDEFGARWSFRPTFKSGDIARYHETEAVKPGDYVKQEYVLDGAPAKQLFAVMPIIKLPESPVWVEERRLNPRLLRSNHDEQLNLNRELRYTLGTTAIRNGRQLPAIPHFLPGESLVEHDQFQTELNHHRQFDAQRFPRLKAIADEVIRSQSLQNESTLIRAIALRNYLFASGKFQYSLDLGDVASDQVTTQVDPLERFVADRRKGHCEYFASALAMMLRSQDIPSRLVVGYKGGDWNSVGQYYLVRQSHAHAWVEVLLSTSEVPPEDIAGKPSGQHSGAWYRLDPTPPSLEQNAVAEREDLANRVSDVFDYADYLWRDYVLGLSAGRQETALEPFANRSRELLPASIDVSAWQRWLQQSLRGKPLANSAKSQSGPSADAPSLNRSGAPWLRFAMLLGMVIVSPAIIASLLLVLRRCWHWQRLSRGKLPSNEPAFFSELKSILTRQGINISPSATASEIAQLGASRFVRKTALSTPVDELDPAAVLQSLVADYHRVRFGGARLSAKEQTAINHSLQFLQHAKVHPITPVNR